MYQVKTDRSKWHSNNGATLRRLQIAITLLLLVAGTASVRGEEREAAPFPHFRHVDAARNMAGHALPKSLQLLTDDDFAPWSFKAADGAMTGISVEVARAACAEAKIECEIRPLPFQDLLPALRTGKGDVIISGLRLEAPMATEFALTRPFFQTLGRFAVRSGSPLALSDIRSLAGRRVGYVKNTGHGAFIETYYSRSALSPFASSTELLEALRTGQVDAAFGDAINMSFWLKGKSSRDCCTFLGKAYLDRATFSRSLSFVARRDASDARLFLDDALDKLESKNLTAQIFARYLPMSVW
jgi:polar amino acid transport system substrate-binding protein